MSSSRMHDIEHGTNSMHQLHMTSPSHDMSKQVFIATAPRQTSQPSSQVCLCQTCAVDERQMLECHLAETDLPMLRMSAKWNPMSPSLDETRDNFDSGTRVLCRSSCLQSTPQSKVIFPTPIWRLCLSQSPMQHLNDQACGAKQSIEYR